MAPGKLPPTQPKPFFDLLDRALSEEISTHVKRPFWIDTVGNLRHVEIRVKLDNAILRFTAPRALTYASNSHIFLMWMVGTSVVLLTVAILFLRNQIRPDPAARRSGRRVRQGPARSRRTSGRAARARCARRRRRSWRCAIASATTWNSARPCWPASVTTCAPCSRASSWSWRCSAARRKWRPCAATSTRCSTCWKTTSPSPRATAARRRRRPTSASCWRR